MNALSLPLSWRWFLGTTVLVLWTGDLLAQQGQPNRGQPAGVRTRVFRLKNFEAERAVQILEELLTEPVDVFIPQPGSPGGNRGGKTPDGPPFLRDPAPGPNVPGPGSNPMAPGGQPQTPMATAGAPGSAPGTPPAGNFTADQLPGASGPSSVSPYPRLPPPPRGNFAGGAPGPTPLPPALPGGPGLPPGYGNLYGQQAGGVPTGPLPPALPPQRYRITADNKTGTVIMRGLESDVLIAADLMAVLDLPVDQPLPKLSALRAFRMKEADPEEVVQKLEGLGTAARIVAVRDLRLVLAVGPEQELKDLTEAILALDMPEEDTPAPARPSASRRQPEQEDGKRPKNEGPTYRDP
jgi:hypothetical protein